jgi:hypothetical protein
VFINNMPPPSGIFGYRQTSHINKLTCNGRLVVPDIHVRQHKSFDITVEENKFVGYRRNYFCLDASFTLTLKNDVPGEAEYPRGQLIVEGQSGDQHVVKAFALSITGVDNSTSAKTIELVQFSPKRDAGKKGRPAMYRVSPTVPDFVTPLGQGPTAYALRNAAQGPDLPYQNAQDLPQTESGIFDQQDITDPAAGAATTHTWERIQFKNATANNGRRRQNQQAFMVVVTLWADIRETRENGRAPYWYPVAKCHSDEVVIRGRSPNHYHPKGNINPAAVANIGASRVHLESSIPQSMVMPSSTRLSMGHPQYNHHSSMAASHHVTNPVGNFRSQAFPNNESTFGQMRAQWTDTTANYPSANVHHYGTHTFDPNRGADDRSDEWETFTQRSASMPLDPLLEEENELSFPFSPNAARRYSSSLSCPEINHDFNSGTPFSALSSAPNISSPASSASAAVVAPGASPMSEWSTLGGIHSMGLEDHKTSFSSVGDWATGSHHDDDEYNGESMLSASSPFMAETSSSAEHLPSSVYPSLDGDGTIY